MALDLNCPHVCDFIIPHLDYNNKVTNSLIKDTIYKILVI